MKKLFNTYKLDLFFLLLILLFAAVPRFIFLSRIPPNITGDEITNVLDILKLFFGKHLGLFSFVGDGTEAFITVYWPAFFVWMVGIHNSILGLRISVSVLSILSLVLFYIYLRLKTSSWISMIMTILLAGNYVFLNFSRTGWVNMEIIFSGMLMLLCLEIGGMKKSVGWYLPAGIFAGITTYGYHYGKILVLFVSLFFILRFLLPSYWKQKYALRAVYFFIGLLSLLIPFLYSIFHTHGYYVLLRPQAVSAFSPGLLKDWPDLWGTILNQAWYTFHGLVLLDGRVMSVGLENLRYTPLYTPPVDLGIKVLFWVGLIYCLLFAFKKISWWWLVGISTLATEFFSLSIPNFARGLFYIVFIYFLVGVFAASIFQLLRKRSARNLTVSAAIVFILFSGFLYYFDVSLYFDWMQRPKTILVREPALLNSEFSRWQTYEITLILNGKTPITLYQWNLR